MVSPGVEELRVMMRKRLSPRRALHTLGVEATAACLAQRWNAVETEARIAALLHDMTKEAPDQLKLMKEYGILPVIWEDTVPNVYHAVTGAAVAASLGYNSGIVSAVRWHATGHANMSLLEKIIYLADWAEPCRTGFPGLREVREEMFLNIDRALNMSLRLSLESIKGKVADKNTIEAVNWIERK